MRATNARLCMMFHRLADRLEISGGNSFQVQAYRRFADGVAELADPLVDRWEAGADLAEIPGVGKAIAEKLDSLFRTGTFPLLERLHAEVPASQLELLHIRGLGPARVRALAEQLQVRDVHQLRKALESGQLAEVKGLGERTGSRIQRSLYEYMSHRGRRLRYQCEGPMELLISHVRRCPAAAQVIPAGSFRRGVEDILRLKLVVVTGRPDELRECLARFDAAEPIDPVRGSDEPMQGAAPRTPALASLRFDTGLHADIHAATSETLGAALAWHTGPQSLRDSLGALAVIRGYTFGPQGLSSANGTVHTPDEETFFRLLGLNVIPPELRDEPGVDVKAADTPFPRLLAREEILGDLHMHTQASDGSGSVLDMAIAARALGHRYIAVTDHTQNVRIANGLTPERAAALIDEVRRVDGQVDGIRILAGLEVDILKDGSLDMPEEILSRLDVAIASVHSHFDQPQEEMTARVLEALKNPRIHILGHPTGRLIGQRSPLQLDMDRVFELATKTRVALELNSNPERLDLNDRHCGIASRLGIPIVISTDAHSPSQLDNMSRGVLQARRGGLTAQHVVNTLPCEEALAVLRRG